MSRTCFPRKRARMQVQGPAPPSGPVEQEMSIQTRARAKTNLALASSNPNLHLLRLPVVVLDHILSYLTISEQLKVRSICKTSKGWVDEKSSRLAEHIPYSIVRHNSDTSFKVFSTRRLPHVMTSLHLENDTLAVFEDLTLPKFVKMHAHNITSIRLKRYFICCYNVKMVMFFERLKNIRELEIDEIWIVNLDSIATQVPSTFRGLKSLKLGRVRIYNEPNNASEIVDRIPNDRKKLMRWHIWNLLDMCTQLDFLKVPISPKFLFDNAFDECFRLLNYIRIRTNGITPRGFRAKQHIMQVDINNFSCCSSSLEVLLIVGARMRIQFLNVNSKIFRRGSSFCLVGTPHNARFDYIHSFLSSSLVNRTFEHIQKLTFKASLIQNECIIGREKGPTLFPNLKEFDIIIDIGYDHVSAGALYSREVIVPGHIQMRHVCMPRADQVLLFFFPEKLVYKYVHTVSVRFDDPVYAAQRRATPEKMTSLKNIVGCFPEVKTLTLSGWNCKRDTFFKVWNGFTALKKLTLDNCSSLRPNCFIGGNGNPHVKSNFNFLPELEYLEFRGLENMPGIWESDENGLNEQTCDVLTKMRLIPFNLLTRTQIRTRIAVWIHNISYSPDPFEYVPISRIVTRSVSKSINLKTA